MSEPTPQQQPSGTADTQNAAATSSERAQAQAVHELSEPERLDGSEGPVGSLGPGE